MGAPLGANFGYVSTGNDTPVNNFAPSVIYIGQMGSIVEPLRFGETYVVNGVSYRCTENYGGASVLRRV